MTTRDLLLMRVLFGIRSLPERLTGRGHPIRASQPLMQLLLDEGLTILAVQSERLLITGGAGDVWKLRGSRQVRLSDAGAFVGFAEPGFAKLVLGFELEPSDGGTRLTTETRVATTDADSRRKFGRYWLFIRLGSGAIRREILAAIRRRCGQPPVAGSG